jgi:hypothetical protein
VEVCAETHARTASTVAFTEASSVLSRVKDSWLYPERLLMALTVPTSVKNTA